MAILIKEWLRLKVPERPPIFYERKSGIKTKSCNDFESVKTESRFLQRPQLWASNQASFYSIENIYSIIVIYKGIHSMDGEMLLASERLIRR